MTLVIIVIISKALLTTMVITMNKMMCLMLLSSCLLSGANKSYAMDNGSESKFPSAFKSYNPRAASSEEWTPCAPMKQGVMEGWRRKLAAHPEKYSNYKLENNTLWVKTCVRKPRSAKDNREENNVDPYFGMMAPPAPWGSQASTTEDNTLYGTNPSYLGDTDENKKELTDSEEEAADLVLLQKLFQKKDKI